VPDLVAVKKTVLLCNFRVHLFSFVKENKLFKSCAIIYLLFRLRGVTLGNKLGQYINIFITQHLNYNFELLRV